MINLKKKNKIIKIIPIIKIQNLKFELILFIQNIDLLHVLKFLKMHINSNYKLLTCISGVDLIYENSRFCIVYELLSLVHNSRIRIKVFANEINSIETSVNIYTNADWWEREIWDLYGIYFENHPDLRRILTDYGFEGYPMRKEFPLSGDVELRYDESKKRIVMEVIELSQEFRLFSFETPW